MASDQPNSGSDSEDVPQNGMNPESSKDELGPHEMYCTNCGSAISQDAEVCPSCGDNQNTIEADSEPVTKDELGSDEIYCTSCGSAIKQKAEVCPECGVRQTTEERQSGPTELSDRRQYELEKVASKDITTTILWSLLITPVGYLKVGKTGLALLNFFTMNYLLLGFIIVPFHTRKMIKDAREELRRAGVAGY